MKIVFIISFIFEKTNLFFGTKKTQKRLFFLMPPNFVFLYVVIRKLFIYNCIHLLYENQFFFLLVYFELSIVSMRMVCSRFYFYLTSKMNFLQTFSSIIAFYRIHLAIQIMTLSQNSWWVDSVLYSNQIVNRSRKYKMNNTQIFIKLFDV